MPNILLTQRCVRSCPYCFADKHMAESDSTDILSWDNVVYLADFLHASGERRFPLLGGEPTLHPAFHEIVVYLVKRGFDVTVFTSGIMSDRKLEQCDRMFKDLPDEKLGFVCNLNNPDQTPCSLAETEAVQRFLNLFGPRVVGGFNIYRVDFELDFLFRWIQEYGLKRVIRLGIAHPIPGKRNLFIPIEQFDAVIERLWSYRPLFERLRVKPGLDCGFPMCRFTDEQLGWLYRHVGGRYDFGCAPVLDIGPDMSVWPCFPLSSYQKKKVFEFDSVKQMHEFYKRFHDVARTEIAGIYPECDSCRARDDRLCCGGCLGHGLTQIQLEPRLRMPEVYP